ncbi:T9SS type A sorting domain-containing protein, partial [Calditrichota bacterium]
GSGIPAIVDFNNDGSAEIVLHTFPLNPGAEDTLAQLFVVNNAGEILEGYPKFYPRGSLASPVVGNITGDVTPEIITCNASSMDSPAQVYAWALQDTVINNFPVGAFQSINTSPVLADLDEDELLEIILWAEPYDEGVTGIYAYHGDGELVDGFPLEAEYGHPDGSPALADFDHDEQIEIVYTGYNADEGTYIYCWEAGEGTLEGFPIVVEARRVVGSPLIADVSGDRVVDIVVTFAPTDSQSGAIFAWNSDGELVNDFPITFDADAGAFAGTPTIADLDLDGDNDIIALTTDRRVMVYDTPGQHIRDEWPTLKGGMDRTGMRAVNNPLIVEDPAIMLPISQELISVYPNPFNSMARISISLQSGKTAFAKLIDLQGRELHRFATSSDAGNWVFGVNAAELGLSSGVYFLNWSTGAEFGTTSILYLP